MTGRERIMTALHGEQPDSVPFSPNLHYWFYNRLMRGTLPEEICTARHPFDAHRFLGSDILARWDTQHMTREMYAGGEFSEEFAGSSRFDQTVTTAFNIYPPYKSVRKRRFVTPHGTLTHTWMLSEEAGADFETEVWWKDWDEYKAIRFMLEATDYTFDREGFGEWMRRIGDDGVMMVHLTQSPLKTFHWLAGAENTTFFIIDHPGVMKELAGIHERKALELLEKVVAVPECEVFISLDNLDSAFYPPYLYKDYCDGFYSKAAEIIHDRGKIFVVHACGQQKALLPLVGHSKIDCLEGVTPPPMGNFHLGEVRAQVGYGNFTVNGGMDATRMEVFKNAERSLHEYTKGLFDSMGDKRHFIYASSCSTSAVTPWENIKYARDAAREYGPLR